MKYLSILFLLLIFSLPAVGQQNRIAQDAISAFFSEYVDDERFDVVYVSGKIFDLVRDADIDLEGMEDQEVKAILEVVKDIEGVRLLHTEENARALYKEARQRIPTNKYELLFKVRTSKGDNVEAFIQDDNAIVNELFLLVGAEESFVMVSFVGVIDLTKISQLQRALED